VQYNLFVEAEALATWITVIGGLVSLLGAFWKDLPGDQASRPKGPRLAVVVIFCGGLLSIVGALLSEQQQRRTSDQHAQFEHDLRTRSDQIAGLSREIADKSDAIAKLNRDIAGKSDEIAQLNRQTAAAVTGGDEFAYLDPLIAEEQNRLFLIIVHRGSYPIYDVGFRVMDFRVPATKPMAEEMLSDTFTIGTLAARRRQFVAYWPIVAGKTHYGLNLFFTARNAGGFTTQQIRFVKVNGKWISASEVTTYNSKRILYRRVDADFPKTHDGSIDWNDPSYSE
jgi:hypothetical protein